MTVLAHCSDCSSSHPLGARALSNESESKTECPNCSSPSYVSETTSEGPSADEMRTTLRSVDGVGERTLNSLEADLPSLTAVSYVPRERLTEVPHVGSQTALRIEQSFK